MMTTDSLESLLREMVRIRRVYDVQATFAGPY